MDMSTAKVFETLPKCENCKENPGPGEYFCIEFSCSERGKYYCEICQDPELEIHNHSTHKTVKLINKEMQAWQKHISDSCELKA